MRTFAFSAADIVCKGAISQTWRPANYEHCNGHLLGIRISFVGWEAAVLMVCVHNSTVYRHISITVMNNPPEFPLKKPQNLRHSGENNVHVGSQDPSKGNFWHKMWHEFNIENLATFIDITVEKSKRRRYLNFVNWGRILEKMSLYVTRNSLKRYQG